MKGGGAVLRRARSWRGSRWQGAQDLWKRLYAEIDPHFHMPGQGVKCMFRG